MNDLFTSANLISLLTLTLAVEATWTALQPQLTALNISAVAFSLSRQRSDQKQCAERLKSLSRSTPHHTSVVWSASVICGCQPSAHLLKVAEAFMPGDIGSHAA